MADEKTVSEEQDFCQSFWTSVFVSELFPDSMIFVQPWETLSDSHPPWFSFHVQFFPSLAQRENPLLIEYWWLMLWFYWVLKSEHFQKKNVNKIFCQTHLLKYFVDFLGFLTRFLHKRMICRIFLFRSDQTLPGCNWRKSNAWMMIVTSVEIK